MYNRQPCVTDDSYQLSYEHLRQLECTGHFRASTEVSPFKFVSGQQQPTDEGKECFDGRLDVEASLGAEDYHICSVAKDTAFRMTTEDISNVFTASMLDHALNSSLASESSLGTAAVVNGKRPWSHFCDEAVNKRVRQENQVAKLEHFDGNSFIGIPPEGKLSEAAEWTGAAAGVGANAKSFEAGCEIGRQITGLDQLLDAYFQISDHSHWKHVPVGPDHQADLPKWMLRGSDTALGNATTSYARHDESSDKWLGTCVMPMPDHHSIAMEARTCYSNKLGCDCTDEGSIECVRKHVMEAREKLIRALGQEEFIRMGFSHMGEIVAQKWTEEEENLFHEVVLSNPESAGRNFWVMLRKAFPSFCFKELVSYYFNVFMLRKRAHQNRSDLSITDSDDDEWQENSDVEIAVEGEEEEDSVLESPSVAIILSPKIHASEVEHEEHLVGTGEDDGCKGLKSNSTALTRDRNSADSEDQDVQDEFCTSNEGLNGVSGLNGFGGQQRSHGEKHHDNSLECRDDGVLNLADYGHTDVNGDLKNSEN